MSDLVCQLRERRDLAGLTQAELAARVGVTRQTLSAIEAGRTVPSTALALRLGQALGCPVEALFTLPPQGLVVRSGTALVPGQRVRLGKVDDHWVAHAQPSRAAAADGLVAGDGTVEPLRPAALPERQALVAGCAPLLGLLGDHLALASPTERAAWLPADSGRALRWLVEGLVHVAGLHLVDADRPEGHAPIVRDALPDTRCTVIHLARWRVGLVVAPGNPLGLRSVHDLLRADVRCVGRAVGSGAHALLARRLAPLAPPTPVAVAADHAEVARLVRWGVADAGLAIEAVADGLGFLPLGEERFDLVVRDRHLATPAVARLLDRLEAPAFRRDAGQLPGHDLTEVGHAVTVHP